MSLQLDPSNHCQHLLRLIAYLLRSFQKKHSIISMQYFIGPFAIWSKENHNVATVM